MGSTERQGTASGSYIQFVHYEYYRPEELHESGVDGAGILRDHCIEGDYSIDNLGECEIRRINDVLWWNRQDGEHVQ